MQYAGNSKPKREAYNDPIDCCKLSASLIFPGPRFRHNPTPLPEEANKQKSQHATQRTICDLRGLARGGGGSGAGRRRSWRYRRGRSILGRGHLRRWNKRHKLVLAAVGWVSGKRSYGLWRAETRPSWAEKRGCQWRDQLRWSEMLGQTRISEMAVPRCAGQLADWLESLGAISIGPELLVYIIRILRHILLLKIISTTTR